MYISTKCMICIDSTKRCVGTYTGKDENGEEFSGYMYLCDNLRCTINTERIRGQKQIKILKSQKT